MLKVKRTIGNFRNNQLYFKCFKHCVWNDRNIFNGCCYCCRWRSENTIWFIQMKLETKQNTKIPHENYWNNLNSNAFLPLHSGWFNQFQFGFTGEFWSFPIPNGSLQYRHSESVLHFNKEHKYALVVNIKHMLKCGYKCL